MRGVHAGLVAIVCLLAVSADAHTRSRSHSVWRIQPGHADVRLHVSDVDLSRIPPMPEVGPGSPALALHLARSFTLRSGSTPCALDSLPIIQPGREGFRIVSWGLRCPQAQRFVLESDLLRAEASSHIHFARVEFASEPSVEAVFAGEDRRLEIGRGSETDGTRSASFTDYLALGVGHILGGWDHLAFVLALLMLARRFTELTALITAFTVAHSVTLAVAALGWLQPQAEAVEAWIGFSIALVAAENTWLLAGRRPFVPIASVALALTLAALAAAGVGRVAALGWVGLAIFTACHFALLARSQRPGPLRAAVAFAFGLVHGFGFAGVLLELELPRERLLPALFGFNVGVELGQLAVVALAWPLLVALARVARGEAGRRATELASAAIAGLGVFWLVSRAFA